MDNDIYGHVNNVNYYSYFDTAVNQSLSEHGCLDIQHGAVAGFVVETSCNYLRPLAFPELVHAGIRVARIGKSSIRHEVGRFRHDDAQVAAAGHFIHVHVERSSGRVVDVPDAVRLALAAIMACSVFRSARPCWCSETLIRRIFIGCCRRLTMNVCPAIPTSRLQRK
jgi:acyl-CoA thioester hydrolase